MNAKLRKNAGDFLEKFPLYFSKTHSDTKVGSSVPMFPPSIYGVVDEKRILTRAKPNEVSELVLVKNLTE